MKRYLKFLFAFIATYKIRLCLSKSIWISDEDEDEADTIVLNALHFEESSTFFLFKIIKRKENKTDCIICFKQWCLIDE